MIKQITRQLSEVFRAMRKRPALIAYAALADLLFILLFAFFSSSIYDKILEYIIAASSLAAKSSPELGNIIAASPTFYHALMSITGVKLFVYDIFIIGLIFLAGIYVFYCFFQGISWHIAGKISGSMNNYYSFMISFLKVNLVWICAYFIFSIIRLAAGFREQISARQYAGDIIDFGIIIPLLAAVFIYFAAVSYSSLFTDKKSSILQRIKSGYKGAAYLIPRYLAAALIIALVHLVQVLLFRYSLVISGIFFVAAELPALTFARIFVIRTMEDKNEKKTK